MNIKVFRRICMGRIRRNLPLYFIVAFLFGLKSYIVYRFVFDIHLENFLQELIIFINPFIVSIIFFGLSVWFTKGKNQQLFLRYRDRKSTRLNSSHVSISYAVFCLKKTTQLTHQTELA